MKFTSLISSLLLILFSIVNFQCKDPEPPEETPKKDLIIGFWRTVEMRENTEIQPGGAYATYDFRADSTVSYIQYDDGGDIYFQFEESWLISDDETQIKFAGEDPVDLISLTETEMTVEYKSINNLTGQEIQHSDDFEKQ